MPVLSDLDAVWTLGGGTGLFLSLNHRISYDIDIFLEDPRALKRLAADPRIKRISSDWQFPGNYLKLIRQEGEIDFILSAAITHNGFFVHNFKGTPIPVETPVEIIAKKIRHRGSRFTVRDVFDFSAAIDHDPKLIEELKQILTAKDFQKTLDRLTLLKGNFSESQSVSQFINTLKSQDSLGHLYESVIYTLKNLEID